MKRTLLILLIVSAFMGFRVNAQTQSIPHLISYQGVLTNTAGVPLNGIQNVTFSLYSQETGGTALWSETLPVACVQGVFDVLLGTNVSLNVEFTNATWLEFALGETVLTPRVILSSSPYAFTAQNVINGSITASKLAPLSGEGMKALIWNGTAWVEQPFDVSPSLQSAYNNGNVINIAQNPVNLTSNNANAVSALDVLFNVSDLTASRAGVKAHITSPSMPNGSSVEGGMGSFATINDKHVFSGLSATAQTSLDESSAQLGTIVDGGLYAGYFTGKVVVNGWVGINTSAEPLYALDVNGDISAFNVHTNLIDVENGSISAGEIMATGNITTTNGKLGIGREDPIATLDVVGNAAISGSMSSASFSTGQMSATTLIVDNSFSAMNNLGVKTTEPVSNLDIQGSMGYKVTSVAENTELTIDHNVVICENTTPITITLPLASSCVGRVYTIKSHGAGIATLTRTASDAIDTFSSIALLYNTNNYLSCITVVSDGSGWLIISKF
jgi:hypothetical protein